MDKKNIGVIISFTLAVIAMIYMLTLDIKVRAQEAKMQSLADQVTILKSARPVAPSVQQPSAPKTIEPTSPIELSIEALEKEINSLHTFAFWTADAVSDLYAKQGKAYQQVYRLPDSPYDLQMYLPGPANVYSVTTSTVSAQLASGYGWLQIDQNSADGCATSSSHTAPSTIVINGIPFFHEAYYGGGMESYDRIESFSAVINGSCQEFTFNETFLKYCPTEKDPGAACVVDKNVENSLHNKWVDIMKTLKKVETY